MTKKRLLPPIVVSIGLLLFGLLMLFAGCAVRHLPGGGTAPATTFEQILAWNAAAAQANDGFASNVISLQQGGMIGIPEAKTILVKQATIASADKRITERISAAATCAGQQAGSTPNAAQLNAAGIQCAQISAGGLAGDLSLIKGTISDLTMSGLSGIKDPVKRQALVELLGTLEALIEKIYSSLESTGVIK